MTFPKLRWRGFPHRHLPRIITEDTKSDSLPKNSPHAAAQDVLRRSLSSDLKKARRTRRESIKQKLLAVRGRSTDGKERRETDRKRADKKKQENVDFERKDSALWRWPSIDFSADTGDGPSSTSEDSSSKFLTAKAEQRALLAGAIRELDGHSVQAAIRTSQYSDTASEHVIFETGIDCTSRASPTTVLSFGDDNGQEKSTSYGIKDRQDTSARANGTLPKDGQPGTEPWKGLDSLDSPIPIPPAFQHDGVPRIKRYPQVRRGARHQRIRIHAGSITEMTTLGEQSSLSKSHVHHPLSAVSDIVDSRAKEQMVQSTIPGPVLGNEKPKLSSTPIDLEIQDLGEMLRKQSLLKSNGIHTWLTDVPLSSSPPPLSISLTNAPSEKTFKTRADRRLIWARAVVARETREYEQMIQRRAELLSSL